MPSPFLASNNIKTDIHLLFQLSTTLAMQPHSNLLDLLYYEKYSEHHYTVYIESDTSVASIIVVYISTRKTCSNTTQDNSFDMPKIIINTHLHVLLLHFGYLSVKHKKYSEKLNVRCQAIIFHAVPLCNFQYIKTHAHNSESRGQQEEAIIHETKNYITTE